MSHPVRDTQDRVDCSQLRSYMCPKCGATGDQPQKKMSSTNGFASLCSQTDILKQFVISKIHYQHNVVWKQDKISFTFHQISQTIKLWNQFNFNLRDTAQRNPPNPTSNVYHPWKRSILQRLESSALRKTSASFSKPVGSNSPTWTN